MDANAILQPVIALGLWSGVMMIWMYVTRIPVIAGADIPEDEMGQPVGMSYLPSHVRRIADNYNHLFEQPTFFYATCIAIAVAGHVDALAVNVAWTFVVLRVVHSLIQATVNVVVLRFGIFLLSWVALLVLLVRKALFIL